MIVTTDEAAALAGVTPATIRQWVVRGHLQPIQRGTNPLRFNYDDVAACQHAKRPNTWRQRHAAAAERWFDSA